MKLSSMSKTIERASTSVATLCSDMLLDRADDKVCVNGKGQYTSSRGKGKTEKPSGALEDIARKALLQGSLLSKKMEANYT